MGGILWCCPGQGLRIRGGDVRVRCTCAVLGVGGSDPPLISQNSITHYNHVVSVMSWFESIGKTGQNS